MIHREADITAGIKVLVPSGMLGAGIDRTNEPWNEG